jgi:hypothetical protein
MAANFSSLWRPPNESDWPANQNKASDGSHSTQLFTIKKLWETVSEIFSTLLFKNFIA